MDLVHQRLCERAGAAPPPAVSRGDSCPRPLCFTMVCNRTEWTCNGDGRSCRSMAVPSRVSQSDFCTGQSKQGRPWLPLAASISASPSGSSPPWAWSWCSCKPSARAGRFLTQQSLCQALQPFSFWIHAHSALAYILALQHTGSFQLL